MGHQFKSLGPCGGAGSSATPGGYNQGTTIAASGKSSGGGAGIQHKDLRGGNTPSGSGYKQGPTVVASKK